jgi:hypothetical protein
MMRRDGGRATMTAIIAMIDSNETDILQKEE